jgi:hypothetical protein
MNLESIVKSLGLPLGVVALIVAVLGLFGLSAEQITGVAVVLVGAQLCIALLINVLKWSGVVNDGTAGKWSAVFNAIIFVGVAVHLKFFPTFDVIGLDAQLFEFAKTAGVVFLYVTQVIGAKGYHNLLVRGFNIKSFSFSGEPF